LTKRSKRKKEIYESSARLFRKKGYAATTIREIAESVKLEPSSLYSHIKSKEEILIDICFDCAELFAEGMNKVQKKEISALEKIEALVDLHIDIAYDYRSSVTVFNDEWRHLPEQDLSKFLSIRNDYEEKFKNIIKSGIENKQIETISCATALNIIINSLKWMHYYSRKLEKSEFEVKRKEIKKFINKGLSL